MTAGRHLQAVPVAPARPSTMARSERIVQCPVCWLLVYAYVADHGLVVAPHERPGVNDGHGLCVGAHTAVPS